jgi:protein TonB
MFDVEEDPEIKPDLAEAALLESMPDPMAGNKTSRDAAPAGEAKRQFGWQPVAKSSDPAPSVHAAAEIGKAEFPTPEIGDATHAIQAVAIQSTEPRSNTSSLPAPSFISTGSGSAAATAPAKEILPEEESSAAAPVFEPQTFATLGGKPERDSDGGGSKKLLLVAAVIVLAAAGAYFGWTKLHQANAVSSVPAPPTPAPTQSVTPPSSTTTAPPQATADAAPTTQPSTSKPEPVPDITLSTAETPAPKSKSTTTASPATPPKTVAAALPHDTLIVKSETRVPPPAPAPAVDDPVEPPAPGALSIGQAAADNGINGIVSAPTSAAQPAATIKLSQGIAQGLLMKRVPPIYPAAARQARIQGAVELQATIGKDGNITNLKQSSGDKVLGHAAIDAVKQWKYRPYLLDGQPVEIQTQVTVNFTLP